MWDVTATYYPMIPTWISELESMKVYILLFWYPQHQRWDNILKNIEKKYIGHIDIEIGNFKILISILILKFAFHIYCYQYWYWKNMNIDIGIDIDIGEIKSIFVDFYDILTGINFSIFTTNFVQLPLWFCQKLEYLLEVFTLPLI